MNVVVPMAGVGSRFRDAGYAIPKPLIPVGGKPMYAWATDSLPLSEASRLIFVLLSSQPEFPQLRADIENRYRQLSPVVLTVPKVTAGQAVTVLEAKEWINDETPLLIHNADTAFDAPSDWVSEALRAEADGALLVFPSDETRWSYSREDDRGRVVEVREKKVISPWASTGTYWFRRGSDFVTMIERRLSSAVKEDGEYYVGPLYNDLIAQGGEVRNYPVRKLLCFGTPDDLIASCRELRCDPPLQTV